MALSKLPGLLPKGGRAPHFQGVARANAFQARTSQGADADAGPYNCGRGLQRIPHSVKTHRSRIPILKQAKAENAKPQ
jgi:hypothetical protein